MAQVIINEGDPVNSARFDFERLLGHARLNTRLEGASPHTPCSAIVYNLLSEFLQFYSKTYLDSLHQARYTFIGRASQFFLE